MECNKIRELLSLYIDSMLDEHQAKELEEHLSHCDACNQEYLDLMEIVSLLNQTEQVPVPDAFQFRMRAALREEKKQMAGSEAVAAAVPKKKVNWRIITSIAAVFAVGILSFGLYDNLSQFLPEGQGGKEQAGVADVKAAPDAGLTEAALKSGESSDGSIVMKEQGVDFTYTPEENDSTSNQVYGSSVTAGEKAKEKTDADQSVVNEKTDTNSTANTEMMYGAALAPTEGAGGGGDMSLKSSDTSETPDSTDSDARKKAVAIPEDKCSRSLTVSGIERNAAAVQYYNNLIEEKLAGFDYQILESSYAQNGEWHFRIFIFRDEDGNTYNEEILIIGKSGEIETICPDDTLGL